MTRKGWPLSEAFTDSVLWPDSRRGPYRVRCLWGNVDGYARLLSFEVHGFLEDSPGLGRLTPITAKAVREIPVEQVAERVLERIRGRYEEFNLSGDELAGRYVKGGRTGRRPLTAGDLERVAAIYRKGGAKPTQAVARALSISTSAAAKRVVRARQAGLLEPTTQGRAGGPSKRTRATKARKR